MEKGIKKYQNGLQEANNLKELSDKEQEMVKAEIIMAMAMIVGENKINANDARLTYNSLIDTYPYLSVIHLVAAIKKGSAGMFGKYFMATPLIICSWVADYMKTSPPYVDVDDWWYRCRGISIIDYCSGDKKRAEGMRKFQTKIFNEQIKTK